MSSSKQVLGWVQLGLVMFGLGQRLREWGVAALADGEVDVAEAQSLAAPIEQALNEAVYIHGRRLRVRIELEDDDVDP